VINIPRIPVVGIPHVPSPKEEFFYFGEESINHGLVLIALIKKMIDKKPKPIPTILKRVSIKRILAKVKRKPTVV
jgi:hypothetical protein